MGWKVWCGKEWCGVCLFVLAAYKDRIIDEMDGPGFMVLWGIFESR